MHNSGWVYFPYKMDSDAERSENELEEIDPVLELAIRYKLHRTYLPSLSKEKKKAVRKRASTITVDKGEVLLKRKGRQVKVVTALEDQRRIMEYCHSDHTSGHFGTTKTWRRVAERFYWKGMSKHVKESVSTEYHCCAKYFAVHNMYTIPLLTCITRNNLYVSVGIASPCLSVYEQKAYV